MDVNAAAVWLFFPALLSGPSIFFFYVLHKKRGPLDKPLAIRAWMIVVEKLLLGIAIPLAINDASLPYRGLYVFPVALAVAVWIWRVATFRKSNVE